MRALLHLLGRPVQSSRMLILSIVTLLLAQRSLSDKSSNSNNAWNLKFSDPNRGGKFLNIPIHYGNWVPITAAKALVEEVANRQRGVIPEVTAKQDDQEAVVEGDRRADHGDVVYINTPHHYKGHHHQQTNYRQQQQHRQPVHNQRRQDASKSIRFSHNNLNVDASRRNTKKLPPPPVHFNQIGQNTIRNKPVQQQQPQQSAFSAFVPSFNSFSAFNPFNFFDTSKPSVTTPSPRGGTNDKSSTNINAIKTIAAPDLSKYGPGPPVIELDSGADGEIILGRPFGGDSGNRDHLAGFVSLDFDGFTPGDREDKNKKTKKAQEKEKLSIIVGGKSPAKPKDQSDLVNFLNNDRENTETFVFSSDKNPPQGFAKIDLPFMDPTKHHGNLPKAFIAPKGIPIPEGYKGKPLPHQPVKSATRQQITTEKVLIHQTSKGRDREDSLSLFKPRPSPVATKYPELDSREIVTKSIPTTITTERPNLSSSLFSSTSLRFKTKERPSLTEFIRRNKKKAALLEEKNGGSRDSIKDANDKVYINNKIEKTRKEFLESFKATETPDDVIIPVENNLNTFKLVTDNHNDGADRPQNNVIDVFTAGDDDNDPISLVFEPEEVLTQSTLEQSEQQQETEIVEVTSVESVESSTSFAPTIVPTTFAETTTEAVAETTTVSSSTTTSTTTSTSTTTTSTSTSTTTTTTSSTTTSTTTTTTVTTTYPSTSSGRVYKYTTQDPFARLESLRKKKFKYGQDRKSSTSAPAYQGDLLTADDIDDTGATSSTEAPAFNNFASPFIPNFRPIRKFGGSEKDGFGRRLRKKPGFWVRKYTSDTFNGSIEPTRRPYKFRQRGSAFKTSSTTTTESSKKLDEYKQKYKPYFENLYSQLTEKPEVENVETSRRYGLPRRRSTTATPPITVDAEVYEIHPKTRLRIPTRSPSTKQDEQSTTHVKPVQQEEVDYYTYQDDYVYEPTTSESSKVEEETTTTTYASLGHQEYVPTINVNTEELTEEASTVTAVVTDANDDVHETADKHSTTTLPTVETTFTFDDLENVVDVDRVELDIENEIDDQIVEESQRIETTWNGVVKVEEHTSANTRLSSYEKNVDTSKYGADTEYNVEGLEPQVNEHSKPGHTGDNDDSGTWQPAPVSPVKSYYEINRSEPIAWVEEVKITESKDYSEPDIIYDVTKEGFDDDKDTFSVPVAVAFNIPATVETETTTLAATTATTTAEIEETTSTTEAEVRISTETTTTVEEVPTTTIATEAPTTTVAATTTVTEEVTTTEPATTEKVVATTNRIYSLIQRNRQSFLPASRPSLGEVFLGTRPTTTLRTTKTSSTTTTQPTTVVINLSKSAHKVPTNLWSSFEKNRDSVTTTKSPEILVEVEEETDKLSPSENVMSYTNVGSNSTKILKELPKPSSHESEVLVENKVTITEDANGGYVPRRKLNPKGKEKWIKDWVSRKYNKPKFPRGPLLPFAPSHHRNQLQHPETTSQVVTTKSEEENDVRVGGYVLDDAANESLLALFAPTMPPKNGAEPKEEERRPLVDKYSTSSRQKVISSLFNKPESSSVSSSTPSKPVRVGVPRGARTEVFKSYAGASLSQADFERNILGVSTATEISVKSMICVKGRCFNADESGKFSPN